MSRFNFISNYNCHFKKSLSWYLLMHLFDIHSKKWLKLKQAESQKFHSRFWCHCLRRPFGLPKVYYHARWWRLDTKFFDQSKSIDDNVLWLIYHVKNADTTDIQMSFAPKLASAILNLIPGDADVKSQEWWWQACINPWHPVQETKERGGGVGVCKCQCQICGWIVLSCRLFISARCR